MSLKYSRIDHHTLARWAIFLSTLLFIIILSVVLAYFKDDLLHLSGFGYIGIFLACLASNSTVFLPAPSTGIVFAAAGIYPPIPTGLVGALGATVGELLGYFAGITGRKAMRSIPYQTRLQDAINRYGIPSVFVFALLPLPLFDLVGVTAGAGQMSPIKFLVPCFLGKLLKMLGYAFLGAGLLPRILPILTMIFEK